MRVCPTKNSTNTIDWPLHLPDLRVVNFFNSENTNYFSIELIFSRTKKRTKYFHNFRVRRYLNYISTLYILCNPITQQNPPLYIPRTVTQYIKFYLFILSYILSADVCPTEAIKSFFYLFESVVYGK